MPKTKKAAVTKGSMRPGGTREGRARPRPERKDEAGNLKRKLGLRGAAPWAARHAAKHAAEARARAAEPPLPGSARATIRTPIDAEDIKQRVRDLHAALSQIKALRKNLTKTFFDIGVVLKDIQTRRLYEAKRFPSFESFVEREMDLGKTTVAAPRAGGRPLPEGGRPRGGNGAPVHGDPGHRHHRDGVREQRSHPAAAHVDAGASAPTARALKRSGIADAIPERVFFRLRSETRGARRRDGLPARRLRSDLTEV